MAFTYSNVAVLTIGMVPLVVLTYIEKSSPRITYVCLGGPDVEPPPSLLHDPVCARSRLHRRAAKCHGGDNHHVGRTANL